jgi:hypothetical protein
MRQLKSGFTSMKKIIILLGPDLPYLTAKQWQKERSFLSMDYGSMPAHGNPGWNSLINRVTKR